MSQPADENRGGCPVEAQTSTRLHVAMLGSLPPERGISAYCYEQAKEMAKRVAIDYLAFRRMYPRWLYPGGGLRDDPTFPELAAPGLTIRRKLTWYNPVGWVFEALRVRGDLIHAQVWSLPLMPLTWVVLWVFRLRGKPIVLTVHNVDVDWHRRWYRLGLASLLRLADRVIVHSASARERLCESFGVSEPTIVCIPHGLLELHHDPGLSPEVARRHLVLRNDRPVVLFFGAIRPHKGLDVLLEAWTLAMKRGARANLVVAGKLWEAWERYQAIIDRGGIASSVERRLDYVPSADVKSYFAAADLVVLPYLRFDAQSGVGLSALAAGKALLVTHVGGLAELVAPGRALPPGDVEALAGALSELLSQPERLASLAQQSRERAATFGWGEIGAATEWVYRDVLDARLGRRM